MENKIEMCRNLFNSSITKKEDAIQLQNITNEAIDYTEKGYFASAIMIGSKYIKNPFKIIGEFNKGKEILEQAIIADPLNSELRFMRYTIQLNTPKFAGYFKQVEEDRTILKQVLIENKEVELIQHMSIFIKNTNDQLIENLKL